MSSALPDRLVLLGPQRGAPIVGRVVESLVERDERPIAVVTAGWEEREDELEEVRRELGRPVQHLAIHRRVEDCYQRDPDLLARTQRRHDELRAAHSLYRERLAGASRTARDLMRRDAPSEALARLVEAEREDAIRAVRRLDRHHLRQVDRVWADFERDANPGQRAAVAEHRQEVAQAIAECGAVCIAGGHVAILVNRLRLMNVGPALAGKTVIAWSAGAMALSEGIVLFHDSPPQGRGDAEVLERGLGVARGVVPLPHASARLQLSDPPRVALLARRFAPFACVALDRGQAVFARGSLDRPTWETEGGACVLPPDGAMPVRASAGVSE